MQVLRMSTVPGSGGGGAGVCKTNWLALSANDCDYVLVCIMCKCLFVIIQCYVIVNPTK